MSPPPKISAQNAFDERVGVGFSRRPTHGRSLFAVLGPDAGAGMPAVLARRTVPDRPSVSSSTMSAAVRLGHHAARVFARAVLEVRNLAQGDHRVH